ncbi:hypothetical protein [Haliangium ochraceum]|uniref:Lipoprotein n=1 Tax=Haliangium ochraceum (strain DSM 14365 / JCM 11303 / SMP-2) TaxID=502025 RepID=D0LFQ5_HALO1|nr:hypothetical protein [Haliangium ochraceum]ACY12689.1 hypothetical protein Hoch_0047 [Haliangium ochraceum DSM 14365]
MRILAYALSAFMGFALVACSSSRSPRCKQICQQESKCIRELGRVDMHFDEAECIAACTVLDRDGEGRRIVDEHAQCVSSAAGECSTLLRCR